MREAIKVVIIGAGPAGIAAAEELAAFGTETILICASQVGGRAGHSTLVPSKVMLDAAEHNELSGKLLSLEDFATLQNRLGETLRAYNGAKEDQVRLAGVEILHGKASFESRSRIKVVSDSGTTFIDFDRAIIATGSNAVFPPGIEPDGERILAPKMIKHLKAPPKDVIVVGAGVTGAEFTYAFLGMGSKVTWIADRFGILPNFDPSLVDSLTKSLERRGVEIISGMAAKTAENLGDRVRVTLDDGRKFEADIVMVGTGRRSDTDDLNLNAAGIRLSECEDSPGAIETDGYSCTNVNNIFAAGDVTGAPMMSNRAAAQGHTAAMVAVGEETSELINSTWGGAVFSRPQIAQVGVTPAIAKKRGQAVDTYHFPASLNLKSVLAGLVDEGFVTLITDHKTRRIIGAMAFGAQASEWIAPVSFAIQLGSTIEQLAETYPAFPTFSDIGFDAARGVRTLV